MKGGNGMARRLAADGVSRMEWWHELNATQQRTRKLSSGHTVLLDNRQMMTRSAKLNTVLSQEHAK